MHFYKHRFQLPDRPGTTIFVQTEEELKKGRAIIESVLELWSPPRNFYHLRKGGHISALRRHKHDQQFARLDVENFFGSVTRNKVHRALKSIGFSFADAEFISHRSCVRHEGRRVIPFGYVQSPILASLVLHRSALGSAIRSINKTDLFVSVFMDDILLSHPDSADAITDGIAIIESAAAEAHFTLSQVKRQGPAEAISAFNIDLAHESLSLTPARFNDFEQSVRVLGRCPITEGIVGYVGAVNDEQFRYLDELM